jgi:transposase-like protein
MRKCNRNLARVRQQSEALLPRIAEMTLLGMSCREIAGKLKVSKTTVHKWRQLLPPEALGGPSQDDRNKAAASLAARIAKGNARRYTNIYTRAIQAWDRSQAQKQVRVVVRTKNGNAEKSGGTRTTRSLRTEARAGDASFLISALRALKAIDAIHLAFAPLPGRNYSPVPQGDKAEMVPMSSLSVDDFHSLTDAQLEALEARLVAKYGKKAMQAAPADAAAVAGDGEHDGDWTSRQGASFLPGE